MEIVGRTVDDLRTALDVMENVLDVGEKVRVSLHSEMLATEEQCAHLYLELVALGEHASYPVTSVIEGIPTLEFDLTKGSPALPVAVIPLLALFGILGIITFGILKLEAITKALLPLTLVLVGGLIIIVGIMRQPVGRIAERAGAKYLPSAVPKVFAARQPVNAVAASSPFLIEEAVEFKEARSYIESIRDPYLRDYANRYLWHLLSFAKKPSDRGLPEAEARQVERKIAEFIPRTIPQYSTTVNPFKKKEVKPKAKYVLMKGTGSIVSVESWEREKAGMIARGERPPEVEYIEEKPDKYEPATVEGEPKQFTFSERGRMKQCNIVKISPLITELSWKIRNGEWDKIQKEDLSKLGKLAEPKSFNDLFSALRRREQVIAMEALVMVALDFGLECADALGETVPRVEYIEEKPDKYEPATVKGEPVPEKYRELTPFIDLPLPPGADFLAAVIPEERKIDVVMRQLKDGVESIQDSAQFRLFLTTMAKFHDYSIGNQILIMLQKPAATRVAGFVTWTDLGRWVKKGESGIAILAPVMPPKSKKEEDEEEEIVPSPVYFKVVHVFDISQTEGKPLPEFDVPVLTGEANEELFGKVLNMAKAQGLDVSFESRPHMDPSIKGMYSAPKSIWVRPEESKAQQLKSLLHEIAHYYSEGVFRIPRRDAETIAESSAFAVGAHYGFDSGVRSFPYVALWSQDKKVLSQNLNTIRKVADTMLHALEGTPKQSVEMLSLAVTKGTCYQDAWRFLIKEQEGYLVHGTVKSDGKRINHAWVETETGYIWEPQTGNFYTESEFENVADPVPEHVYEITDAAIMVARSSNFGPWSDEERAKYLNRKVADTMLHALEGTPKQSMVYSTKLQFIKVGERVRYIGTSKYRYNEWPTGAWLQFGVEGTVSEYHPELLAPPIPGEDTIPAYAVVSWDMGGKTAIDAEYEGENWERIGSTSLSLATIMAARSNNFGPWSDEESAKYLKKKQAAVEYLPDTPEYLAETINAAGYQEKLDDAFQEAIARVRKQDGDSR